jgi:hypothetical protein
MLRAESREKKAEAARKARLSERQIIAEQVRVYACVRLVEQDCLVLFARAQQGTKKPKLECYLLVDCGLFVPLNKQVVKEQTHLSCFNYATTGGPYWRNERGPVKAHIDQVSPRTHYIRAMLFTASV